MGFVRLAPCFVFFFFIVCVCVLFVNELVIVCFIYNVRLAQNRKWRREIEFSSFLLSLLLVYCHLLVSWKKTSRFVLFFFVFFLAWQKK
jgi:hypothetical protein